MRYTWKEKILGLGHLWVVVVLVIAIIGGIYSGTCTPTEAGAFGAFVMFMLALLTGRATWQMMWDSIRSAVVTTGMILIIIVAAVLFARFLTLSGFSRGMSEWIVALDVPRIVIFLIMVIIYIILGCFVGAAAMMMMTLPVFYPVLLDLGYDSIWLGVEVVILCEVALETPPVGVNLYATKGVAGDIPLSTIIQGTFPFIVRDLMALVVVYLFPQIATFLPSLM
jgi:tripartite ATP-independent transporter DctM subunit